MDRLLGPGMRMGRRVGIAGKFLGITLMLLFPLSIIAVGSVHNATRQIHVVSDERDGVTLARPLTLLLADLSRLRIETVAGGRSGTTLSPVIAELDAADHAVGARLGTTDAWRELRVTLVSIPGLPTGSAPWAQAVVRAGQRAEALLTQVANSSQLILDPQLDSYYIMIVLVDRLPSVLVRAADAAEQTPVAGPASEGSLVTVRRVTDLARGLSGDLATATTSTEWRALPGRLDPLAASFGEAVGAYSDTAARGRPGLIADRGQGIRLTAEGRELTDALAHALTELLDRRHHDLALQRAEPLLLTAFPLVVMGYLVTALYRATTSDVRRVVEEINSITTGALNATEPLANADEFGQMSRAVVVARDRITSLLGTLRFQATHDELTGLANQALLVEKIAEGLRTPSPRIGVMVIGLQGFKDVHHSFGHAIGDRLLRALGARFHRAVRRRDLVARLGADEFGVLLVDAADEGHRLAAVQGLERALDQPVDVDGRLLRVRASIGLARPGAGGTTATELVRNAYVAMHAAQIPGSPRTAAFEPAMLEETRDRTELSFDLVQALEHDQLSVVYQPIIDLATGTLRAVEALVRWDHPVRGPISPAVFVPLAEATGLIVPVGRWVMREALGQLAAWRRDFPAAGALTMDVNLAADQLTDPRLVDDVLSAISDSGIEPASLVLEITESALVQDWLTALHRLEQLAAIGIRLALDDFGTGYSSLSYLRKLPVTELKIDKSFVTDLPTGPGDGPPSDSEILLRGIASLGTGLGMQIVAEGIETVEQVERLRAAGCHLGQGYLWSKPLPEAQIGQVLERGGHLTATAPAPPPLVTTPDRGPS